MLRHGGSQPRKEEGASRPARRGKNAEAFLKYFRFLSPHLISYIAVVFRHMSDLLMPVVHAAVVCDIDDVSVSILHFCKGRHGQIPDKGQEEEADLHRNADAADQHADEQSAPEMCRTFCKRS